MENSVDPVDFLREVEIKDSETDENQDGFEADASDLLEVDYNGSNDSYQYDIEINASPESVYDCYTYVNESKKRCIFCGKEIGAYKSYNLKRHLARYHIGILNRIEENKGISPKRKIKSMKKTASRTSPQLKQATSSEQVTQIICSSKKKEIDLALTEWIAADLLSFQSVDSPFFRKLMHSLNPGYQPPSGHAVSKSLLTKLYERVKTKVIASLAQCQAYCLTFDHCICSHKNDQYLALTAHFIDLNWTLSSCCIGSVPCNDSIGLEEISNAVSSCINDLGLENPIFAVTECNTIAVKICDMLKLERRDCIADKFDFCVEPILLHKNNNNNALIMTSKVIEKTFAIVSLFEKSQKLWSDYCQIYKNYKKCAQDPNELSSVKDCKIKLNSVLPLFKQILNQSEQLEMASIKMHIPILAFSIEERSHLADLYTVLKPFEEASNILCENKHPTSSLVLPSIYGISRSLRFSTECFEETSELKQKLQTQVNSQLLSFTESQDCLVATYLDPRFKIKFFTQDDRKRVHKIIENHSLKNGKTSIYVEPLKKKCRIEKNTNGLRNYISIFDYSDSESDQDCESPSGLPVKLEITSYENEKQKKHFNFDVLNYWGTKQSEFPILSALAKIYLCIPATSVESERLYSKVGELKTDCHSQLNSKNLEKLIFVNRNINRQCIYS